MPNTHGIRGWLKTVFSSGGAHVCTEGVCIPKRDLIVCRECGEEM
jgi:hypothetical protein